MHGVEELKSPAVWDEILCNVDAHTIEATDERLQVEKEKRWTHYPVPSRKKVSSVHQGNVLG